MSIKTNEVQKTRVQLRNLFLNENYKTVIPKKIQLLPSVEHFVEKNTGTRKQKSQKLSFNSKTFITNDVSNHLTEWTNFHITQSKYNQFKFILSWLFIRHPKSSLTIDFHINLDHELILSLLKPISNIYSLYTTAVEEN